MAEAPHPAGPAEPDPVSRRRRGPHLEDSLVLGGLAGIFLVTLATLALSIAAGVVAFVVTLVL